MIVSDMRDEPKIKAALLRPGVVYSCVPDGVDAGQALEMLLGMPNVTFLGVFNREDFLGCFVLVEHDAAVEVHTCLLPACFGPNAIKAGKKCIQWIRSHFEKPIVSVVPEYNRLAAKYAERLGLVQIGYGVPWTKDGIKYESIVYGGGSWLGQ